MRRDIPPDKIYLHAGRVIRFEQWSVCNGTTWCACMLERRDSFFIFVREMPGQGRSSQLGTFKEVCRNFDPATAATFLKLFEMQNVTEAEIQQLGWNKDVEVICT